MKSLRIIVDDNIPFIKGRLEKVADVVYTDQFGFTPDLVRNADAVVIRTRTRCNEALLGGSNVRLVATATIGIDQIDTAWCAAHGITVRNAPGCNAPGVAQYVWSSLLRSGFDPGRHTLGIVGCGNVGSIVGEWGRKLGVRILVNDPPREQELSRQGWHTASLEELLAQSDAVTLHTPLTRTGRHATFHLISAPQLALMKPRATIVNAARGPVTDTEALKKAIRERSLTAIIDTWEGEPAIDTELLDMARYATFHIAGYSLQGKQRATRMALEAVAQHFGADIDMSGLEPAYTLPASLSAAQILESYDPAADDRALRAAPQQFDVLRANYDYRPEP